MQPEEIYSLLAELTSYPEETAWIEFKLGRGSITNEQIGEYISAMSNGATISNQPFGYMAWGVEDQTHRLIGTDFTFQGAKNGNQDLELWLRNLLFPKISFTIHDCKVEDKYFVILKIPAAVGEPTNFQKKPFIRIGSNKTDLRNFPDYIRQIYNSLKDWSAEIVGKASISDLDPEALQLARSKYKERNSKLVSEIDKWEDLTLLDKAKITINGRITRTALILLGKEEASHYLLPAVAQITWKLDTDEKAYEHYGMPLILSTTSVLHQIRNFKYKFFPENELLSTTVNKYDSKVILEALHNCIAHQDYNLNSRILVTEKSDKIIFSNTGSFFEGKPDDYCLGSKTPKKYRNPWLAHAMVNLNMIDTLGYGIHTMYLEQRKRFFPLPQYNLQVSSEVELTIYGHSIDEKYSKLLLQKTDLPLSTIILLDRIQKNLPVPDNEIKLLKSEGFIEGRKPNYIISETIARQSGQVSTYLKSRGFDNEYYKKLLFEFIQKNKNGVNKQEIRELLLNKLPDRLEEKQKLNKISNILGELKRESKIINTGSDTKPCWKSII
jgi:ATP-dependent DNA helicase RecG